MPTILSKRIWWIANEITYLLPSKKGGAGGVLARTTGRTLPNQHPLMVGGWGLLCRHFGGVRIMNKDILNKINHYEYMLKELDLSERHKYWIVKELQKLKENEREVAK